jgi:hypothetical protein
MSDEEQASRFNILLAFLAIIGLGATLVGFFGVYAVLTGSGDTTTASVPDAFECDRFDGDPEVGHPAAYGIGINASTGELESIDATTTDEGFELELNVSDPEVLNASARHADGRRVPVSEENGLVSITHDSSDPFRIWIDSADGGTITRSELDICPPA